MNRMRALDKEELAIRNARCPWPVKQRHGERRRGAILVQRTSKNVSLCDYAYTKSCTLMKHICPDRDGWELGV